jgi:hypothetical protein
MLIVESLSQAEITASLFGLRTHESLAFPLTPMETSPSTSDESPGACVGTISR